MPKKLSVSLLVISVFYFMLVGMRKVEMLLCSKILEHNHSNYLESWNERRGEYMNIFNRIPLMSVW